MTEQSEKRANVLYVDDLQTNLILFQATFENEYNVILAESASLALDIMKEQEIQVLVTDQRMPDMTGTELLEIVTVEYPDTRRFLLTAFTDFETVVEAVNKGRIHGYINKPVKADEVRLSINNSLEVYYLRKKNQQVQDELEEVNRKLMSLDGLKTEIIKVISQEIRNPLNRIMGTLHLLKDKIEGEELTDVVNVLDSSVSRLESFSSMTEQISILKSPGYVLKLSELDLREVIEYSLIETSGEIREKEIDVNIHTGEDGLSVKGERHLLISCLVNLVRNAGLHCNPGGSVRIRTSVSGDGVRCEVSDEGKNYNELLVADLEKHFGTAEGSLNLNLGIELGLAQMIMEAHNGRIVFARQEDGRGSVTMVFSKASP